MQIVEDRNLGWASLSSQLGYQPKTLQQVLSDSVVMGRKLYNFRILGRLLTLLDL